MHEKNIHNGFIIKPLPPCCGEQLKAPRAAVRHSGDDQHPIFSFQFIDPDFSITKCQKDDKSNCITKISTLSKMTWQEINEAPRHGLGTEIIDRDCLKIKIPKHVTPDVHILAFRFSGEKPMLGYREFDVFHIIAFDDKFNAYKHS